MPQGLRVRLAELPRGLPLREAPVSLPGGERREPPLAAMTTNRRRLSRFSEEHTFASLPQDHGRRGGGGSAVQIKPNQAKSNPNRIQIESNQNQIKIKSKSRA